MLAITHDVTETKQFDRVLVIEGGKILEDGPPEALYANPESRYRALCDAEAEVRERMWEGPQWRRLRMESGILQEELEDDSRRQLRNLMQIESEPERS